MRAAATGGAAAEADGFGAHGPMDRPVVGDVVVCGPPWPCPERLGLLVCSTRLVLDSVVVTVVPLIADLQMPLDLPADALIVAAHAEVEGRGDDHRHWPPAAMEAAVAAAAACSPPLCVSPLRTIGERQQQELGRLVHVATVEGAHRWDEVLARYLAASATPAQGDIRVSRNGKGVRRRPNRDSSHEAAVVKAHAATKAAPAAPEVPDGADAAADEVCRQQAQRLFDIPLMAAATRRSTAKQSARRPAVPRRGRDSGANQ